MPVGHDLVCNEFFRILRASLCHFLSSVFKDIPRLAPKMSTDGVQCGDSNGLGFPRLED